MGCGSSHHVKAEELKDEEDKKETEEEVEENVEDEVDAVDNGDNNAGNYRLNCFSTHFLLITPCLKMHARRERMGPQKVKNR